MDTVRVVGHGQGNSLFVFLAQSPLLSMIVNYTPGPLIILFICLYVIMLYVVCMEIRVCRFHQGGFCVMVASLVH